MSGNKRYNAVVGQSGGPTAVINQSLVGIIEAVKQHDDKINRLLGARFGTRGIIEENFIDLTDLEFPFLERIAQTPCAALGSTRDKPDEQYCKRIFKVFEKNDVHYFFYIGGNDSADTARIVAEMAQQEGYDLRVFHIPKTIDNDLRVTDHCPGYGSAARFVAAAVMGDGLDNASLPGIKIDVIMGRNAGWLAASTILAKKDESDAPHLIYVPESPLTKEQFINDVSETYDKYGRCLVCVSEGIVDETGQPWSKKISTQMERDAHGNIQLAGSGALGDYLAQLVRTEIAEKRGEKLRIRADTFGYLQRSFPGYASPVDQAEARLAGKTGVEYACSEDYQTGSVAFRRTGNGDNYAIECFRAELQDVARETKPLPAKYINEEGNGITKEFREYVSPLVGELPAIAKLP